MKLLIQVTKNYSMMTNTKVLRVYSIMNSCKYIIYVWIGLVMAIIGVDCRQRRGGERIIGGYWGRCRDYDWEAYLFLEMY